MAGGGPTTGAGSVLLDRHRPPGRTASCRTGLGVWLAGALYWAMSPETVMAKNVARCPRALVHLESARDVVIVEGAVDCPDAPMLPAGVVEAYQVKYDSHQEAGDRGMPYYVLRAETVRSWSASDIRSTGIRWQFD